MKGETNMSGTIWALVPPIVAIALALWTKEVYLSLLIGILSGALLFTKFHILAATQTMIEVMNWKIGDNVNILLFLVFLGIIVALITKSGASQAYGDWASRKIKSQRGALFSTMLLGVVIFVDDYFNCLTVGTVMRPVTDKYKVSRAKLAYIIDATAAPVCIIAPISSWAAAVGSSLPDDCAIDGFSLFLKTIPFNLYAILTIVFMIILIGKNFDYGAMAKYHADLVGKKEETADGDEEIKIIGNGKVIDLILPIIVLIVLCISAMLYTGGILDGAGVATAFADCDSSLSLVLGSFFTLIFIFFFYLLRRIITFSQFCESFVQGFKAMTPAIMILSLDSVRYLLRGLPGTWKFCRKCGKRKRCHRCTASGTVLRSSDWTFFLHRNILGNLRYHDPDRNSRDQYQQRILTGTERGSRTGWCCMR